MQSEQDFRKTPENLNSVFINEDLKQSERLEKLNKIAISQMQILNDADIKYLK